MSELNGLYDAVNQLIDWAQQLREAGILLTKEPHATRKYTKTTISTSLLGDPDKHARGLPYHTVKKTTVQDNVLSQLDFLDIPDDLEILHEEKTAYKSVTDNNIYFLPTASYTKTQQPVLQTLNWDKSVVQPGDLGPVLKFFPLLRIGSYQGMALFLLLHKFVIGLTSAQLWMFIMLSDSTYGSTNIARLAKQYLTGEDFRTTKATYDLIHSLMQSTSLVKWMHQVLKRQIMANLDYKNAIQVIGDPAKLKEINEAMNTKAMTEKLLNIAVAHKPKIVDLITDITYTEYTPGNVDVNNLFSVKNDGSFGFNEKDMPAGTTTTVTTRSVSITSDGAYCEASFTTKPVFTQSLLKNLTLFKQTVTSKLARKWNPISGGHWLIKTAHIPTTSWEDVTNLATEGSIVKKSISGYGIENNVGNLLNNLNDLFYNDTSVQSASVRWEAVSGKYTENINKVYWEESK